LSQRIKRGYTARKNANGCSTPKNIPLKERRKRYALTAERGLSKGMEGRNTALTCAVGNTIPKEGREK